MHYNMGSKTRLVTASLLVVLLGAELASGIWKQLPLGRLCFRCPVENLPAIDSLTEIDRDLQQALVVRRTLMFIRQASEEASKMRKAYEQTSNRSRNAG